MFFFFYFSQTPANHPIDLQKEKKSKDTGHSHWKNNWAVVALSLKPHWCIQPKKKKEKPPPNPEDTPSTDCPSEAFVPLKHFIYFFALLPNEQLDQREKGSETEGRGKKDREDRERGDVEVSTVVYAIDWLYRQERRGQAACREAADVALENNLLLASVHVIILCGSYNVSLIFFFFCFLEVLFSKFPKKSHNWV